MKFIIYNIIIIVLYYFFDFFLELFGVFSNEISNGELSGITDSDMNWIMLNIFISNIIGVYIMFKIKDNI